MRLFLHLLAMNIRKSLEHRVDFMLGRVAIVMSYGSFFATVWVLVHRFEDLGGWRWPEMVMLLSFQLLAYSLGASFSFVQFRDLSEEVRLGKFDVLMIKPVGVWFYKVFSSFEIGYVGHIVLGAGMFVWSLGNVQTNISAMSICFLLLAIISSAAAVAAIFTAIGISALILVRPRYLYEVFFSVWELARFPLTIFPMGMQIVFFSIAPIAFFAYVPVSIYLDKELIIYPTGGLIASLALGPVVVTVVSVFWKACMDRYSGAGG